MRIRPYERGDEAAVIALWRECGLVVPHNDPVAFLVGEVDSCLVASVMAGYEGHRGWINYLAVAPSLQGNGNGRQIMEHAEQLLRERGCPKINLQIRSTNQRVIEFYQRLGFAIDDVVSMGKRLIVEERVPEKE